MAHEGDAMGKIRLVASDIDGTLILDHDSCGIDPRVFDEIRELGRRGATFVVASGRQYFGLRKLFAPVADDIVYLCENGTLVMDGARTLVKDAMPRDLALELCREIVDYPGLCLLADGVNVAYMMERDQWLIDSLRVTNDEVVTPIQSPDDIKGELIKVAFWARPEAMDEAFAYFEGRSQGRYQVTVSGSTWIDILPHGANKGTGLRKTGEVLGIEPAEMVAFGDNINDAEMLDLVGRPYLMATGRKELRALNQRIRLCDSVHGKLAELLSNPDLW